MFVRKSNRAIDLTGKRFGLWTVLQDSGRRSNKKIVWTCQCDCGVRKGVVSTSLLHEISTSCGCKAKEDAAKRAIVGCGSVKVTHSLSSHRVYPVYQTMIARCHRATSNAYKRYGAKGISVCDRWKGKDGFVNFIHDMGLPDDGMTIERIDNNKGYSPDNCRWATRLEQCRNKSTSRFVNHNGERVLLLDLAKRYGIPYKVLHQRHIQRGWPLEIALNKPLSYQPKRTKT